MIFPTGMIVNAQDVTPPETTDQSPAPSQVDGPPDEATTDASISVEETQEVPPVSTEEITETSMPASYLLEITTIGSGQVVTSPEGQQFQPGSEVRLEAIPAQGWQFLGWSGSVTGTANPGLLVMDGEKSIIATFAEALNQETPVAETPSASVSLSPVVEITATLTPFISQPGFPSIVQPYIISGVNLTEGIHINAPAGFEVSTASDEGFSSTLFLSLEGSEIPETTIYLRLNGEMTGQFTGSVSHLSAGAPPVDLAVEGFIEASLFSINATAATAAISFTGQETLGKPTDQSIAVNIVPDEAITYYYEYGTSSGSYPGQTGHITAAADQPSELVISGLSANTKYYYRMQYSTDSGATWLARDEHAFQTQRSPGSSFTFDVTSDSHASFNSTLQQSMVNIRNDQPDFLVDLGDTFYPGNVNSQSAVNSTYLAFRNSLYFGAIGPSVPIFLTPGNHEEEEGWNLDDTPFSVGVGSIQARKAFFPTPIDDGFYSANTDSLAAINEVTYGDELREDYYAWTWGDALFVVIDVFEYTPANPYGAVAGEGSDDPASGDQWNWTLGEQQYNWLKDTLENSDAKYKFVFSHNMLGGIPRDISVNPAGYVRGGAEAADYFEWGGKNANGSAGFASHRPGWDMPIHQLFVANGVSAYFHGHDHQYVYETRDGVVYQEVPSTSMSGSGFGGIYTQGDHGSYNTIQMMPNAGHLRVTVNSDHATVDYVRSGSGDSYSYTINPAGPSHNLTVAVDPAGSGTTSPTEGAHTYPEGEPVDVTAAPAGGFVFDHWSGDCSGSGACSVVMDADKTVTAHFVSTSTAVVTLDGAVSTATGAANATSVTINHTTGSGTNRLLLVGASWNAGSNARSISSITFTYGSNVLNLTQKIVQTTTSQANRYAAIWYSPTEPPQNTAGTVTITFSGQVSNGIVTGAANFSGVNQSTPFTISGGANNGSATSTPQTVTLNALNGNELVFDTVFIGASTPPDPTVDPSQTRLWTGTVSNTRGVSSTEQATGSSVTMSWTTSSAVVWASAAVAINPAPGAITHNLTTAVDPAGGGTTNPAAGVHPYAENQVVTVTASAATGYLFDHWSGACTGSGTCQVTMDADKSVTANFTAAPVSSVVLDGTVSNATGAANASSVSFAHTTGSGNNRLLLVGASWNGNNDTRTISSVTFTYGSNTLNLSQKIVQETSSTARRFTAIWYSPTQPPQNTAGTVTITFSGQVSNGIVAGAANFAGVDQATPLTASAGANSSSTGTTQSVTLSSLNGNELVFDTVFIGAQTPPDPTVGAGQTRLWTNTVSNTRGVASTESASGSSSVTMSWTTSAAAVWASAAVAINPASTTPGCYALNLTHTGQGSNPIASPAKSTACSSAGQYVAGENINLSGAAPADNWYISGWTGTSNDASTAATNSLTMPANSHAASVAYATAEITFTGAELLGQPTNNSIAISVLPDADISLYYQYGTTSGGPYTDSPTVTAAGGQPKIVTLSGLSANTKYYYRMRYSRNGSTTWVARPEHSFYTQRAAGSTYSFTITTDGHVNISLGSATTWTNTLNDVKADNADFEIDLGDTIAMDNGSTSVAIGDTAAAEQKYKDALPFFNIVSPASPIFLVPGNHEQQEAWHLQAPLSGSLPIMGKNAEKKYFLNPSPNSFYIGDTGTNSNLSGDHLRQAYYAWTWGDALFVVINPFWFTTTKPYTTTIGGGETDATGSGDRWDWTLGQEQFNWLKTTLQNSTAKYKFVFSHQIVGGNSLSTPDQVNYGHGGVDSANLVEWGGYNVGGTTWGWDTERSGWGSQTIHQMMVANGVSAFFHGHDHQYAYEKLDGVVYQAVPAASFSNGFNIYSTGGNNGKTIQAMTGPGHLKVTVGPTQSIVDYFQTSETSPAYSYSILPPGPSHILTVTRTGDGYGTITSSPTGLNCGSTCSVSVPHGTPVTLSASLSTDGYYRLSAWSGGGCSGSGSCTLTVNSDVTVNAAFVHSTFYDVPFNHQLYDFIQTFYEAGFTAGCQEEGAAHLLFCPDQTMLRAESSVFMLRGLQGASYTPPAEPWNTFFDDWSAIAWAEKWAEGMWMNQLTAGCQYPADDPEKLFCPYTNFTRDQGAVFGLRIMHGADYTPPAATGTVFSDSPPVDDWSTKWLEQAYADNLLLRCDTDGGQPAICPTDLLDRGWAAYMIDVAKGLALPD